MAAAVAAVDVHGIHAVETWRKKLEEAAADGKLVVVDFTATWCGPCKMIAPFFTELSRTYPSVVFLKVDVDEMPAITTEWKVEAMPTFIFIKDGKCIDKVVGVDKKMLEAKVKQHCGPAAQAS